jgi:hypothetical protein
MFRVPSAWPVATVPAHTLAYYERYVIVNDDGPPTNLYGFYSINGVIDTLRNDLQIDRTGYCVIMPSDYGPGRFITLSGVNTLVPIVEIEDEDEIRNIAWITQTSGVTPINITVNEISAGYICTLTAKGVYSSSGMRNTLYIRTPYQLSNISTFTAQNLTTVLTFIQERNMDFATEWITPQGGNRVNPTTSIVTGNFTHIYVGGGNSISNLTINSTALTDTSVGLFRENNGTIQNLTLNFNRIGITETGITGTAANAAIGAVVGTNNGTIHTIALNLNDASRIIGSGVGASVGAVAGTNSGNISNITLNINGTSSISGTGVGANVGAVAGTSNGNINNANITLSNTASILGTGANASVGGVAGQSIAQDTNGGTISSVTFNIDTTTPSILASGDNARVGGIAGISSGTIQTITLNLYGASSISGTGANASVGGIAGVSNGTLHTITLNLNGTSNISGTNTGANVGGIAGNNSGTASRILVVFNGESSVSASENDEDDAFVGGIAGTNTGTIRDLTVVSTLVEEAEDPEDPDNGDDDTTPVNAVIPVRGTQAGGIVGNNSGMITRVLYLAPAPYGPDNSDPDNGDPDNGEPSDPEKSAIYPIVYLNTGTGIITDAYFLAGEDAKIYGVGDINITLSGASYEYDLDDTPAEYGIGGDTGEIIRVIGDRWLSSGWTDTSSLLPLDFTTEYPYPRNFTIPPTSWPVTSNHPIPDPEPPDLPTLSINDDDPDDVDTGNAEDIDSEVDGVFESTEGIIVTVGAITLISGYSFTKTEPFRSLLRKSNARAVRKINEHNDRKRRK